MPKLMVLPARGELLSRPSPWPRSRDASMAPVKCDPCATTPNIALNAIRRPRNTPISKLAPRRGDCELSLVTRSVV
jgi:hypothetical protein